MTEIICRNSPCLVQDVTLERVGLTSPKTHLMGQSLLALYLREKCLIYIRNETFLWPGHPSIALSSESYNLTKNTTQKDFILSIIQ